VARYFLQRNAVFEERTAARDDLAPTDRAVYRAAFAAGALVDDVAA
jgi:hypothetical protein